MIRINLWNPKISTAYSLSARIKEIQDLKKRAKEIDKANLRRKLYDLGYYDEVSRSIFKRARRILFYPFRWIRWKLKRKNLERARRWMEY